VKGESNDKTKTKFSGLAWPSRILSYEKIVKGESNDKTKTKFSGLAWPSRILSYEKIVKGESNDKTKTKFSGLAWPSHPPSTSHILLNIAKKIRIPNHYFSVILRHNSEKE
jgi:hypothetical protein